MTSPISKSLYKAVKGKEDVPLLVLGSRRCLHAPELDEHQMFHLQVEDHTGAIAASWVCDKGLVDIKESGPERKSMVERDLTPSPVPRDDSVAITQQMFSQVRGEMRGLREDRDYWRTAALALMATQLDQDGTTCSGWYVEATPEGLQAMQEKVFDEFELIEKNPGPLGGRYFELFRHSASVADNSAHRLKDHQ